MKINGRIVHPYVSRRLRYRLLDQKRYDSSFIVCSLFVLCIDASSGKFDFCLRDRKQTGTYTFKLTAGYETESNIPGRQLELVTIQD